MIAIINFGSKKTPAIAGMIRAAGDEAVIVQWDEAGKEEVAAARGIVFSGSPTMFTATDPAPYFSRYDFVKEGKIPVLAICFGHQLLGLMHGAKIFRAKEVCATIPITLVKEDPLFKGLSPKTEMAEDHTEGITLPAGFIHLASSATYTIEGMRHPVLPLWGVQFHPEVSGENGQLLFRNFLELCVGKR
jgi:GMP synthase (glutamine-hydrolysing)